MQLIVAGAALQNGLPTAASFALACGRKLI